MGPLKSLNKKTTQSCKNGEDCCTFKPQYRYSFSGTLFKNNIPADVLVSMEPVLSAEGPHRLQLGGCHVNNVLFSVFSKSKNCWLCSKSVLFCFFPVRPFACIYMVWHPWGGHVPVFVVGVIPEQKGRTHAARGRSFQKPVAPLARCSRRCASAPSSVCAQRGQSPARGSSVPTEPGWTRWVSEAAPTG